MPAAPTPPFYDSALEALAEVAGEIVSFDELSRY
jgi:hypothetical protein